MSDQNASTFHYDDFLIPTHSPKKKVLEKDLFSLEGCIEELKSFSLNKFRGNDGLPVECLRLFGVQ